jgi:hypothetical protein
MTFLKYFIVVTVVPLILDLISYKKEPKNYTKSLDKFIIRTGKSIIFIGIGWFVLSSVILVGVMHQEGVEFTPAIAGMFVVFYFLALLSFLYATPRFWDIVVNGDSIKVIKFFIFTKKTAFSEITKVEIANNNYLKIYKDGRKKAFFLIDPMMNGKNNFLKRIEKENIQLIDNRNLNGNVSDDELEE